MPTNPTPHAKTAEEVAKATFDRIVNRVNAVYHDRDAVMEILAAAIRDASSSITVDGVVYGENMIRLLQQQANECRAAGFLDDAGNVRRVLGKLILTEDGCVIPHNSVPVWHIDGTGKALCLSYRFVNDFHKWYSTREAAEVAEGDRP